MPSSLLSFNGRGISGDVFHRRQIYDTVHSVSSFGPATTQTQFLVSARKKIKLVQTLGWLFVYNAMASGGK